MQPVTQASKPTLLCSTGPFYMMPVGQIFDVLSKAGYAGAEVMVTAEKETQDPKRLLALSEDFGVRCDAVHAPFLLLTRNVYTSDPLEKIRRSTDLAQQIGAPLVVVHPAYRWQGTYHRWLEDERPEYGQTEQVTIAVENMFPVWLRGRGVTFHRSVTPEDMTRFDDVVLDTSHAAVAGVDVIEAFTDLTDRLRHIHLSNNLGNGRDTHSPLDRGVLPIEALLKQIGSSGYTGTITLEMDVRAWAGKPADLIAVLRDQREYCEAHLGIPAAP